MSFEVAAEGGELTNLYKSCLTLFCTCVIVLHNGQHRVGCSGVALPPHHSHSHILQLKSQHTWTQWTPHCRVLRRRKQKRLLNQPTPPHAASTYGHKSSRAAANRSACATVDSSPQQRLRWEEWQLQPACTLNRLPTDTQPTLYKLLCLSCSRSCRS